ncbi:MAG: DegT/DnrJ/EryC1/StrS family aminotransferase [Spirochaetales bacterium]|nr:DegT/DnrJ/EryC1/StrS family aminotransferase [Spirochaetales bacterium]
MNISVFKPSITRKEMDAVLNCMVSDRIGFGKASEQFVKDLSDYLELNGGLAFKEYFRALKTAFDGLSLEKGSVIAVSALAPNIYLDAAEASGFDIRVIDVDPDSSLIDINELEAASSEVDAVIVNYDMGFVPDMERIADIELPIIEDISMALGASLTERKAGTWGQFTVINLDEDGIITVGGGAVVLSSSRKGVKTLNSMAAEMHPTVFLPDMNASLGSAQLKNLEAYLSSRSEISEIFTKSLMRSRHKKLSQKIDANNIAYTFPVLLETGMAEVAAYSSKKNVMTAPTFASSLAAFSEDVQADCPNAKALLLRCVNFPLYPMLGKNNISTISKVLASLP